MHVLVILVLKLLDSFIMIVRLYILYYQMLSKELENSSFIHNQGKRKLEKEAIIIIWWQEVSKLEWYTSKDL